MLRLTSWIPSHSSENSLASIKNARHICRARRINRLGRRYIIFINDSAMLAVKRDRFAN